MIRDGSVVRFEYTLSDENGEIIQLTRGKDPVTYTHGQHEVIPGLEKGLSGMQVNEQKSIRLQPEEAFGPVDPHAFQDMPRGSVPLTALQVGLTGELPGPGGSLIPFKIHAVHGDTVTLDLNHPLAGQDVIFEVWVRHIQT